MTQPTLRVLALALAVLAPLPALAQQKGAPTAIGIKAAPVFSSLSQGPYHWKNRKGVVGGVTFGGQRPSRIAWSQEALYLRKGAANLGGGGILHVIELPFLMRVNFRPSVEKGMKFYGLAGPALDLNVPTHRAKVSRVIIVDAAVVLAAGVQIQRVTIEARENIGLRTLAPNTPNLKSRVFSVMAGIQIR